METRAPGDEGQFVSYDWASRLYRPVQVCILDDGCCSQKKKADLQVYTVSEDEA